MNQDARIFVAGTAGWSVRRLFDGSSGPVRPRLLTATREQLDLRDQAAVNYWFRANRPEYVFLVAGTVGGILANSTRPAEFLYDNMMIHGTVVHAAHLYGVEAAAVSRQLLHLSARVPAADEGRVPAERPARTDQRGVRARQDRRHQVVPGLSQAVRLRTSSPRCRRICTVRKTTSTSTARMSCRR